MAELVKLSKSRIFNPFDDKQPDGPLFKVPNKGWQFQKISKKKQN